MDENERQGREMNLNAHFSWALAMWASADVAREEGLFLPASIGYYYSAFHAAFAVVNSNLKLPLTFLARARHGKLQEWIEDFLPGWIPLCFAELRALREGINYLGLGDPASKLRAVQGGALLIEGGAGRVSLDKAVERARLLSLIVLRESLNHLQTWGPVNNVIVPHRSESQNEWLDRYMQEDFLESVLPSDDRMRSRILKKVCYPLTMEAESETRAKKSSGFQVAGASQTDPRLDEN